MIRHMIDDLDASNFSDNRLEESILVNAQMLKGEVQLINDYVIEVDNRTMTPDPTLMNPKDDNFIALCCLKTAIMCTRGLVKIYAMKSFSIKDGPTSLDMRGVVVGLQKILDDLNEKYDELKTNYIFNENLGKAILAPYSPASNLYNNGSYIDPRSFPYY